MQVKSKALESRISIQNEKPSLLHLFVFLCLASSLLVLSSSFAQWEQTPDAPGMSPDEPLHLIRRPSREGLFKFLWVGPVIGIEIGGA